MVDGRPTPVIKFGGKCLQGPKRFAPDPETVLERCRCATSAADVYEVLATARNRARAEWLVQVAQEFIIPELEQGRMPVVVVSAFDVATDKLEWLAAEIFRAARPDEVQSSGEAHGRRLAADCVPREFARLLMSGELRANSSLAMVLELLGVKAKSLTGREAGILTRPGKRLQDGKVVESHPAVDAMVDRVEADYLVELIREDIVPVVAGFQGYYWDEESGHDEVSIMGRGGSNLTAVALAEALGEKECTMISDVDGVYDRPPQEPGAQKLSQVAASNLYKLEKWPNVIQQEALAYAAKLGINIWIKSGFLPREHPGSLIVCEGEWEKIPERYRKLIE